MRQIEQKYDLSKCHMYDEKSSFAFWIVMVLFFCLAIGNLALTLSMMNILKIYRGMESIELIQDADTIKFYGDIDFDRVYKKDGLLESFYEDPLEVTGDAGSVSINLVNRNGHSHNKIQLSGNNSVLKGVNHFDVKDTVTGRQIFGITNPHFTMPQGPQVLNAKLINAARIASPVDEKLSLLTQKKLTLKGTEGIRMEAREVSWTADQTIFLKSDNGSTMLIGKNGVSINLKHIPVANSDHGVRTGSNQYKLCVCYPQGRIFRIAVPKSHISRLNCANFSSKDDPCA
ncbi:AGAP001996-PA-like protein [Anopheles sinensis]|uniref:Beta-sarcoglycan n=1 Tax=Anopheles sinensis TaxID=74873 RepID=A0A084VHH6_ANOSI|nr:AGAP001996-PA-like protein [Anopheles sinensis]